MFYSRPGEGANKFAFTETVRSDDWYRCEICRIHFSSTVMFPPKILQVVTVHCVNLYHECPILVPRASLVHFGGSHL